MGRIAIYSLNGIRWLREHWISWGVLAAGYVLGFLVLFEHVFERAEAPYVALLGFLVLFFPFLLARVSFSFGIRVVDKRFRMAGFEGSLFPLYVLNELRNPAYWLTLIAGVAFALAFFEGQIWYWIIIVQIPVQRALYGLSPWRILLRKSDGSAIASDLVLAVVATQSFGGAVVIVMAFAYMLGIHGAGDVSLLALGSATVGALASAASVCLEGDSGRPLLVNLFSLVVGTLGGLICYLSPACLLIVVYLVSKTMALAADRHRSVEFFDEDTVVS